MTRPRPLGFDYEKPDAKPLRCSECNADGGNRTGRMLIAPVGASPTSTTIWKAIRCPAGCNNGLKKRTKGDGGMSHEQMVDSVKLKEYREFEYLRYGCPAYDCTYGAKCPMTNRQCSREICSFIYWTKYMIEKLKGGG